MNASILLARMIGPVFVAVSIGVFVNPVFYRNMVSAFLKDPALYYFSGAAALAIGLAMVAFHNIWVGGWPVLITVIGWMSVAKGAIRLILPMAGGTIAAAFTNNSRLVTLSAVPLFVIGLFLSYQGYFA